MRTEEGPVTITQESCLGVSTTAPEPRNPALVSLPLHPRLAAEALGSMNGHDGAPEPGHPTRLAAGTFYLVVVPVRATASYPLLQPCRRASHLGRRWPPRTMHTWRCDTRGAATAQPPLPLLNGRRCRPRKPRRPSPASQRSPRGPPSRRQRRRRAPGRAPARHGPPCCLLPLGPPRPRRRALLCATARSVTPPPVLSASPGPAQGARLVGQRGVGGCMLSCVLPLGRRGAGRRAAQAGLHVRS